MQRIEGMSMKPEAHMDRLTEIEQHMARVMSVAVMSEAEYHEYKEDTWAALQWAVAEVKRLREEVRPLRAREAVRDAMKKMEYGPA